MPINFTEFLLKWSYLLLKLHLNLLLLRKLQLLHTSALFLLCLNSQFIQFRFDFADKTSIAQY